MKDKSHRQFRTDKMMIEQPEGISRNEKDIRIAAEQRQKQKQEQKGAFARSDLKLQAI